jgi:hypothetical protein
MEEYMRRMIVGVVRRIQWLFLLGNLDHGVRELMQLKQGIDDGA